MTTPDKKTYLHFIERELDNELVVFKASQSRPSVDEKHLWANFANWLNGRPIGRVAQMGLASLITTYGEERVAALIEGAVSPNQVKLRRSSDPAEPTKTIWQTVE